MRAALILIWADVLLPPFRPPFSYRSELGRGFKGARGSKALDDAAGERGKHRESFFRVVAETESASGRKWKTAATEQHQALTFLPFLTSGNGERTSQLVPFPRPARSLFLLFLHRLIRRDGLIIPGSPCRAGKGAVFLLFFLLLFFFLYFLVRTSGNRRDSCRGRGRSRRPLGDARVCASLRRLGYLARAGKNGEEATRNENEKMKKSDRTTSSSVRRRLLR